MRSRFSGEKVAIFSYFTTIIFLGSFLLYLPLSWNGPEPLPYLDAFFTATSAVCVTGLITVDTASFSLAGKWVILILIQFGGLGLISFATVYLAVPRKRISLVNRGIVRDFYVSELEFRPTTIIRSIVLTTLLVEGSGAILLYAGLGPVHERGFAALFHAVSAFCNAGFSSFSSNLEGYVRKPLVSWTVMVLIFAGGIGFMVFRDLRQRFLRRRRRLSTHSRMALLSSAALIIVGAVAFYLLEANHAFRGLAPSDRITAAFFAAVTPRTAGFDTIPPASFSDSSVLLTIILMFIGASPASTGGGIKTTTFFIALAVALKGTDERDRLNLGRRSLPAGIVIKAFSIIAKGLAIVFLSVSLILIAEHAAVAAGEIGLVQVVFESVSAFGTVGLSLGITAGLGAWAKIVLILTMFAGRIGLFAMSLPASGSRIERYAELPGTTVLVG
jgi:trk system potassium uptake protein TrkH